MWIVIAAVLYYQAIAQEAPTQPVKSSTSATVNSAPNTHSAVSPSAIKAYAQSAQWRTFLQMNKGFILDKSRVEPGSLFFTAVDGFKVPLSELQESLRALSHPTSFDQLRKGHPHCLYPARLKILNRDLGLRITPAPCPDLDIWKNQLRGDSISVMFAGQFVTNPASVMGHTFIKFNSSEQPEYMNLAVGYAADIDESVGAVGYVYKGLFGGFAGTFSIFPMHLKFHEYSNMDSRSVWEFPLQHFKPDDIDLLLDYIWELRATANIDYFFSSENCSFGLMALLQVLRPQMDLTETYGPYVTPYMTLIRLAENDLIAAEKFYPSLRSKTLAAYNNLSRNERKAFHRSLHEKQIAHSATPQTLDTLLEYLSYTRESGSGELPKSLEHLEQQTLLARAPHGKVPLPAPPTESSPLRSHKPHRARLGHVQLKDSFSAISMGLSAGIHAHMDDDSGFLPNSSFEFLNGELFYETTQEKLYLNKFTVIDVRSSPEFHTLLPAFSWSALLEQRQDLITFCRSCTVTSFRPGFGVSWYLSRVSMTTLFEVDTELGRHLQNSERIWARWNNSLVWKISDRFKFQQREVIGHEVFNSDGLPLLLSQSFLRWHGIFTNWDLGAEWTHYHFFEKQNDFWSWQTQLIYHF